MSDIMGHLRELHDIPDEALPSWISVCAKSGMGIDSCPLCDSTSYGRRDDPELVEHVLEHMHDFSLRALPWQKTAVSEPSAVDGPKPFVIDWLREQLIHQPLNPAEAERHFEAVRQYHSSTVHFVEEPSSGGFTDYFADHPYFGDDDDRRSSGTELSLDMIAELSSRLSLRTDSDGRSIESGSQRNAYPNSEDIYIAVMGATGAGKSTFISLCTASKVEIGHSLHSCTRDVELYPVKQKYDRQIWLVDTPGFDDVTRTDKDVLKEIATRLSIIQKEKVQLHGIIYLHRITDARLGGSAMRNLMMFKKLCGEDALKKVVLATTMWGDVDEQVGESREQELKTEPEYWGWMIGNGSAVFRHQNTEASALSLIDALMKRSGADTEMVLKSQKERVEEGRSLRQAELGIAVGEELTKAIGQQGELEKLEKDLGEAPSKHDGKMAEMLGERQKQAEVRMAAPGQQTENLEHSAEPLWEERDNQGQEEYERTLLLKDEDRQVELRRQHESHHRTVEEPQQQQNPQKGTLEDLYEKSQQRQQGGKIQDELSQGELSQDELLQPLSQEIVDKEPEIRDTPKATEVTTLCLFGDRYWVNGGGINSGNSSLESSSRLKLQNATNEYYNVALGDQGSWFARCRGLHNKEINAFSDNFRSIYPGAHAFLHDEHPDEEPTFVSLSTDGYYFVRTSSSWAHYLPASILSKLKVLALNPLVSSQYAVVFGDGAAKCAHAEDNFVSLFRKWCAHSYGISPDDVDVAPMG
ncbi:hypothetical protein C8035_v006260 [Colletotrichum spinosum]|uniref:G domain-containing protein n=1 Tax=Colletotrichum spinosum TaxID=1347390 RepID=A0A4R8QB70_9PEZI|nr:hypothetical protein C8035_v006260 [Colletotrichum spinosum]